MLTRYHKEITEIALKKYFSPDALDQVIKANIRQDLPQGQIGHPEYHFDDSEFLRTSKYLNELHGKVISAMEADQPLEARTAFGKITHANQDFYAHSTYIRLWDKLENNDHKVFTETDTQLPQLLNHPNLISGRFYAPWEWITFFPVIGRIIGQLFPNDSHARINLDTPRSGHLFIYAFQAAVFRTEFEYNQIIKDIAQLHPSAVTDFTGLNRG